MYETCAPIQTKELDRSPALEKVWQCFAGSVDHGRTKFSRPPRHESPNPNIPIFVDPHVFRPFADEEYAERDDLARPQIYAKFGTTEF